MRTTKHAIAYVCDACKGHTDYAVHCLGCGVDHCLACRDKEGVEYQHAVNFMGTDDGYYCHACDKSPEIEADQLHQAYVAIAMLRRSQESFYHYLSIRGKEVEANLQVQLELRRGKRDSGEAV